jgi:hypothetical protein
MFFLLTSLNWSDQWFLFEVSDIGWRSPHMACAEISKFDPAASKFAPPTCCMPDTPESNLSCLSLAADLQCLVSVCGGGFHINSEQSSLPFSFLPSLHRASSLCFLCFVAVLLPGDLELTFLTGLLLPDELEGANSTQLVWRPQSRGHPPPNIAGA